MSIWVKVGLIALGGALGALLRTGASELVGAWSQRAWLGTLVVNLVGCLVMGFSRGAVELFDWGSPEARVLLFSGFLGAFTTFSTFKADAVGLWGTGSKLMSIGYLTVSVAGGALFFMLGWWTVSRAAS